ncbi:hypothetical protein X742_23275 [Mesorhizobium sp. LNHC232B00]|nr:hypothetical protein X742_23275 [Mesorhizobium sp. LNHC232B00]
MHLERRAIAGGLHDPTPMNFDGRIDEVASQREIACKRTIFLVCRQAAEADDVRHQDCRELAHFGHCLPIPEPDQARRSWFRFGYIAPNLLGAGSVLV